MDFVELAAVTQRIWSHLDFSTTDYREDIWRFRQHIRQRNDRGAFNIVSGGNIGKNERESSLLFGLGHARPAFLARTFTGFDLHRGQTEFEAEQENYIITYLLLRLDLPPSNG